MHPEGSRKCPSESKKCPFIIKSTLLFFEYERNSEQLLKEQINENTKFSHIMDSTDFGLMNMAIGYRDAT